MSSCRNQDVQPDSTDILDLCRFSLKKNIRDVISKASLTRAADSKAIQPIWKCTKYAFAIFSRLHWALCCIEDQVISKIRPIQILALPLNGYGRIHLSRKYIKREKKHWNVTIYTLMGGLQSLHQIRMLTLKQHPSKKKVFACKLKTRCVSWIEQSQQFLRRIVILF